MMAARSVTKRLLCNIHSGLVKPIVPAFPKVLVRNGSGPDYNDRAPPIKPPGNCLV